MKAVFIGLSLYPLFYSHPRLCSLNPLILVFVKQTLHSNAIHDIKGRVLHLDNLAFLGIQRLVLFSHPYQVRLLLVLPSSRYDWQMWIYLWNNLPTLELDSTSHPKSNPNMESCKSQHWIQCMSACTSHTISPSMWWDISLGIHVENKDSINSSDHLLPIVLSLVNLWVWVH